MNLWDCEKHASLNYCHIDCPQSLGLLINLVEHNVTNARILTLMKTNHSYDSQAEADQTKSEGSVGEVSSISALTEVSRMPYMNNTMLDVG